MRIIYPPRPRGKVPPTMLPKYEQRKQHVAQRKFNGHRNLVHISTKGVVSIYGRHGGGHGSYKMPLFLQKEISGLNLQRGEEYWLDSELLHPRIPDTIVLYDVLQAGSYLLGVLMEDRLSLLNQICHEPSDHADPAVALKISEHVWMAETFYGDFRLHFNEFIHLDLIEGLVLKQIGSALSDHGYKQYEVDWQIRCRKPGASYGY